MTWFDELNTSLGRVMPCEPVNLDGRWIPVTRRAYQSRSQLGSGSAPFVDVIDYRWKGTMSCSTPIAGVAFMHAGGTVRWSKSQPAMLTMPIDLSLSGYADYMPDRATFGATLGGATLSAPFEHRGELAEAADVRRSALVTARVERIAHVAGATFFVLLLDGRFLQVGRHRLWRVKEDIASSLPPDVRELLTRKRNGVFAAH